MEVNVKNILIVTGGSVDYMWAEEWLKKHIFDYVIAADSGLVHCDRLNINVDFLLGDYDSVDKDVFEKYSKNTTTKTYPPEKNYTDTHLALIKAIEKRPDSISIIGATGTRYDHALTNIGILKCAMDEDIQCAIYDANNKIYLADKDFSIEKNRQYGDYLSFVPYTEHVCLTLSGVKYPLKRYSLKQGLSICQSNEIIDEAAHIGVEDGIVIVFETRDNP